MNTLLRVGYISLIYIGLCTSILACSMSDLVHVDMPTQNGQQVELGVVETYNGAVGLYGSAVASAAQEIANYTRATGLMTDELGASDLATSIEYSADTRTENVALQSVFNGLSRMRVRARYARGALQRYPEYVSRDSSLVGELYALEAIAEVFLAEGFCSGVPLSTVPYGENLQYTGGFTRSEVLRHAVTLFDTALSYADDRAAITTLARVGQGRALLNLGEYDRAAEAVAAVPTEAVYLLHYLDGTTITSYWAGENDTRQQSIRLVNAEGGNGLFWIASTPDQQDSRVPVTTEVTGNGDRQFTTPVRQAKYTSGTTTQHLADGVEARLIQAEAALRKGRISNWADTLNMLRAMAGIPPLPMDSTTTASLSLQVNTLFHERAFWLYLTGHRQGDLRRLIRDYGRAVATTYPSGRYPASPFTSIASYEPLVTIDVPADERKANALYHGCESRLP